MAPPTHKSVIRLSIIIVALWLIFIIFSLWYFANYRPDDLESYDLNENTSYEADFTRFFSSVLNADFQVADFLAPNNWIIYLTLFLTCLGAIGGLLQIACKLGLGYDENFSSDRRGSITVLSTAIAACVIFGTFTVLSSTRRRYILSLFYVLEVHINRFEGLVLIL